MNQITGILQNTTQSITGQLSQGSDHRNLTGRSAPDQHPIDSISALEAELSWRPDTALSNADILEIMEH